jgi:hypothetical protein
MWRSFSPPRDAPVLDAENDVVERHGAFTRDTKCAARMQSVNGGFDFHVKLEP